MRHLLQTQGPDALTAEAAARQHGVVARSQLLGWGLRPSAIDRRLRLRRLHRVRPGIYAVGHNVLSREARWIAAVLACGPGAVLSHRSAAVLWRMRSSSGLPIEVTAPTKARSPEGIHRHFGELQVDEVRTKLEIPVTTAPRTLLDLATALPVDAVERALRESERLRLYDALSLDALLVRYPGHRGNGTIRECIRRLRDLPAGVAREELEARFLVFLDRSGLPRPRLNAWIGLRGRRYQADCVWPERRVIVELDGFATHGTRGAFEGDRERDRILQAEGWSTIRVTWRQLHEQSASLAADLSHLLHLEQYKRT
jgi:hypothetical protein